LKTEIVKSNVSLENILKATRSGVTKETSGEQTPWYESSIDGDVFPAGNNRMSIEALIKSFLPDANEAIIPGAYYLMGWDPGDSSAIHWTSQGLESDPKADTYKLEDLEGHSWSGPFRRKGEVIITMDGNPVVYALGKKPVPWEITMIGAHGGVEAVGLSSGVLSQEFDGFSRQNFLVEDKRCRKGGASDGQTVFAVRFPNRHPAFLAEAHSCGSGGCGFDYTLFLNKKDKTRYGC
jgi:hypothetical protein